eukprot:g61396.t1
MTRNKRRSGRRGGLTDTMKHTLKVQFISVYKMPPKRTFGGGEKCIECDKTVYPNEKIAHDSKIYHAACFKCSLCNGKIAQVSEAGSMHGQVSHRRCFEKQMRETGGKYGGETVVAGALKAKQAGPQAGVAKKPLVEVAAAATPAQDATPAAALSEAVVTEQENAPAPPPNSEAVVTEQENAPASPPNSRSLVKKWEQQQAAQSPTPATAAGNPKSKKFTQFGGGDKCSVCTKTVYPNEKVMLDSKIYHAACFTCSLCKTTINKVSEAGSMHGQVSHRRCFEKQMRETGGKYGGEKVVRGALTEKRSQNNNAQASQVIF